MPNRISNSAANWSILSNDARISRATRCWHARRQSRGGQSRPDCGAGYLDADEMPLPGPLIALPRIRRGRSPGTDRPTSPAGDLVRLLKINRARAEAGLRQYEALAAAARPAAPAGSVLGGDEFAINGLPSVSRIAAEKGRRERCTHLSINTKGSSVRTLRFVARKRANLGRVERLRVKKFLRAIVPNKSH
jgi:hypothetical protein